jgi:murein DD-endopeptidase MepM/ murein hydrolase activator NlpD
LQRSAVGGFGDRLRAWFPDREFFMRSQGQVRFIRVSSRFQMIAAGVVVALTAAWLLTMAVMVVLQYIAARDRLSLLDREAQVAKSESRVADYRDDLSGVTADLQRRQDFIIEMVESHVGDLPTDVKPGETVSNSTTEAAETIRKVSAEIPEAAGLARIEARQLAFVEALTRVADRRAAQATEAIRKLGLDPGMALASLNDRSAQGGPLLRLASAKGQPLDPRFQRLGLSLARMDALQRVLEGVPQVLPASLEYISSGFGYRSDPFTGGPAFHAGLDFKGPTGAPVYAAAQGRISFVGVKPGYGKTVEIDHGSGLMTRYAHLSGFRAQVGKEIEAGQVLGLIGSTGRSTGPHLHFEVRVRNRAVNPRPFLENAPHVLKEINAHRGAPTDKDNA